MLNISDESRVARQREEISDDSNGSTSSKKFGSDDNDFRNTDEIGGVHYIRNKIHKFLIPERMNSDRRSQISDRLASLLK